MSSESENVTASIRAGASRLLAIIEAAEAENGRLEELLAGVEGIKRSAADSLSSVIEEAEERLHEAATSAREATERAAAAELQSSTIREAALNVVRVFDEGGFDLLRGEDAFEVLDQFIATLGVERTS